MIRSFIVGILVAASLAVVFPVSVDAEEFVLRGNVKSVEHGDTFTLTASGEKKIVYLRGTDAPDKDQKYWSDSKKRLTELVTNKTVEVRWSDTDGVGRLMAEVFIDGTSLNNQMIEDGWSWHYSDQFESEQFAKSQEEARKAKRGIWQDSNAVAPWIHRASKVSSASVAVPHVKSASKTKTLPPVEEVEDVIPSAPSVSGGTVHVKGYYRKNGTYVQPHTRSAPMKKSK